MKISLRKAMTLQAGINDAISQISLDPTAQVSIFAPDRTAVITAARAEFDASIERTESLIDALYLVRALVAEANETSGVSNLLTRAARLDRQIRMLTGLASAAPRQSDEVIDGRMQRLMKADDRGEVYGRTTDMISIGLFTAEEVEANKRSLREVKLEKQRLQEEISERNVRNTITLPEATAALLQDMSLL